MLSTHNVFSSTPCKCQLNSLYFHAHFSLIWFVPIVISLMFTFTAQAKTSAPQNELTKPAIMNQKITAPDTSKKLRLKPVTPPKMSRKKLINPDEFHLKPTEFKLMSPTENEVLKAGNVTKICWNVTGVATKDYRARGYVSCDIQCNGCSGFTLLGANNACQSESYGNNGVLFEGIPASTSGCFDWQVPDWPAYRYLLKVRIAPPTNPDPYHDNGHTLKTHFNVSK